MWSFLHCILKSTFIYLKLSGLRIVISKMCDACYYTWLFIWVLESQSFLGLQSKQFTKSSLQPWADFFSLFQPFLLMSLASISSSLDETMHSGRRMYCRTTAYPKERQSREAGDVLIFLRDTFCELGPIITSYFLTFIASQL